MTTATSLGQADLVKRIRLNRAAVLSTPADHEFRLTLGSATAGAGHVPDWMIEQLRRLQDEDVAEEELQAGALAGGGPAGLFRWVENVRRLDAAGMLARSITMADEHVCTIRPLGSGPSQKPLSFDPAARQRLSRFTVVRADGGVLLAQHPSSHLAVELGRRSVAVLGALTGWASWLEVEKVIPELPGPVIRAILDQFARAGLLDQAAADWEAPFAPAGDDPAGLPWNPFDWWLHSRTRNPRIVTGWGGSYPGRGRFPRLPAVADPFGGRIVPLPVPDLTRIAAGSQSVVAAMEGRRSIRTHDAANPLTVPQLSELLYRSARTRSVRPSSGSDGVEPDEIVDRTYPGGGALHELEIYPVVRNCAGLDAGMYHYRSSEHTLEWVRGPGEEIDQLLWAAQSATTMADQPQLLLVISARFGRLMFKYETIAYALTLKHVGVLMQNLYLVATDMGLAATAVGSGDASAFAAATGRNRMAEGSVGEFVIGSMPSSSAPVSVPASADVLGDGPPDRWEG